MDLVVGSVDPILPLGPIRKKKIAWQQGKKAIVRLPV